MRRIVPVAAAPNVLKGGRRDVVAVVSSDGRPEVRAMGIVNAGEAVPVDAGALLKAFDVFRDEMERGRRGHEPVELRARFGENGNRVRRRV